MYKFILSALVVLFGTPALFAQCIQYNCPTQPIVVCDMVDNNPQFWNETYWLDTLNDSHDLAEAATDVRFQVIDTCGAVTLSYALLLDLDNNGVLETRISSDSMFQPGTVPFGNLLGNDTPRTFDERLVATDLKYRFSLQQTVSGDTITGAIRWNTEQTPTVFTDALLPLGKHQIVWYMRQENTVDSCVQNFRTQDCKPPVINCISNFSLSIETVDGLFVTHLLQSVTDNVTPSNALQFSLVRASQSTNIFPLNADGSLIGSISLSCEDIGVLPIQLWVKDQQGNVEFCETAILVLDNYCDQFPVWTCAATPSDQSIDNVSFMLQNNAPGVPPVTTPYIAGGCWYISFNILHMADVTIMPVKDDNHINGVSSFDLVLLSKHILGIQPITSPYTIIAADVNNSKAITSYDIVELRKLVLGIYSKLPNNTSWRFVNKKFVFPNLSNPWQTAFPEMIQTNMVYDSNDAEFVGIKIGDINGNALPSLQSEVPVEARSQEILTLPDLFLQAGETMEIPLQMTEAAQWSGFQAGLNFDPQNIDIEIVESNALPGFDENAWAKPQPGHLNISWFSVQPQTLLPDENLLTLRVHARTDIRLRDVLTLNNESLRAEAYSDQGIAQNLSLQFREQPVTTTITTIFPAQPNPTTAGTLIPLRLQSAEKVVLEVFDASGKLIFQQERQLDAGAQMLEISALVLQTTGVYTWRVQAGAIVQTGKIIRI